jgi:aspartyl-tRNA(Asn)/glutamyl-tRNA(Gln) amidotransferase subunit A
VSRGGVFGPSWTQDHVGPMTRTVEDTKKIFEVIAGFYDERDNATSVSSLPTC